MKILAGDIGGTHSRLTIIDTDEANENKHRPPNLKNVQQYQNSDFPNPETLLQHYLNFSNIQPDFVCLAVAAPVPAITAEGQTVTLTNLAWTFSSRKLEQQLKLSQITFINDFAGIPYALTSPFAWIDTSNLFSLQEGSQHSGKANSFSSLYLGAGTGLGCVIAHQDSDHLSVLQSEGGHCDISGSDSNIRAITQYLEESHQPICWESLLSGAGLERLFKFVLQQNNMPAINKSAQEITDLASGNPENIEGQVIKLFCTLAGVFSRNMAFSCLPRDIFLVGNIFEIAFNIVSVDHFLTGFHNTTQHKDILKNINITLVKDTQIGLKGAAAYAMNQFPDLFRGNESKY